MSRFSAPTVGAIGLMVSFSVVALAQGAQKECEVNESRPAQIGRATLAVQVASSSQDPAAAAKQLTAAVKGLTDPGALKWDNQSGRNLVLGKALVLWSMQPNVSMITKRGPLGFQTDPEGTVDLAAAIDSAFDVVEAAAPECISETSKWRGQKPWVDLVNKAIERLNNDEVDSAHAAAERAIMLNPHAPYGYVVMANVLQKRNQSSEAFKLYRQAVEVAGKDTAYNDIRRQSLVYLGNLAVDSAEGAANAEAKKPYIDVAKTAFTQLLADKDAGDFLSNARAGMCRVAIASGDTASLRETYKAPLDAPASFTYGDLMNAAVCLARAEMRPEATKLFEAAYEKNAFHRDALSNLAIMYLQADNYDRSLPLASRLVAVEPNNPEDLQLLVLSYAGIAKRARDARLAAVKANDNATKAKAPATKGAAPAAAAAKMVPKATIDSLEKIELAYTDSAVSSNERKEKLGYKVTLSDFSTTAEKATVAGSVANIGSETKSDSITIKVDFLDGSGNVVQTKTEKVAAISPGSSARFSLTATPGTNITAFRYERIQ